MQLSLITPFVLGLLAGAAEIGGPLTARLAAATVLAVGVGLPFVLANYAITFALDLLWYASRRLFALATTSALFFTLLNACGPDVWTLLMMLGERVMSG